MKRCNWACLLLLCSGALGCSKSPLPSPESDISGGHIESALGPLDGIYSIVDPDGEVESTGTIRRSVKEIIGDQLGGVEITLRRSGSPASETTEKQIFKLFQNSERVAFSTPIWNIDWEVQMVGTLKYRNGLEGKFAISGHKIGFQDKKGQPWYFEWEENYP